LNIATLQIYHAISKTGKSQEIGAAQDCRQEIAGGNKSSFKASKPELDRRFLKNARDRRFVKARKNA
jgi:hypothetical protein